MTIIGLTKIYNIMKTKKVRPVLISSKVEESIIMLGVMSNLCRLTKDVINDDEWLRFGKPQKLILISLEDEKIENNEAYYDGHGKIRIFGTGNCYNIDSKKIIARQSQIPPEYISKFIEQYNDNCIEDLEIEMKTKTYQPCDNNYEKFGEPFNIDEPKLHNGFVTIVEKEPISYTEEEVINLIETLRQPFEYEVRQRIKLLFENNKKK